MSGTHEPFEGVQIVASLYDVGERALLTDVDALLAACRTSIDAASMQRVAECSHSFVEGGGVSVAIVLSESHVAVHTWPEFAAVTLDVYACSYHRDNTEAARGLVDAIAMSFDAGRVLRQEVPRDRGRVYDQMGSGYGVYVDTNRTLVDEQSAYQRVELHESPAFGKILRLDGRNQCSEVEAFIYHEAMVHPAATAHPEPRDVLVVGGGDGGVAAELLRHPSIRRISVVEIDEAVIAIAKEHFAPIHGGAFDDARVDLIVADGRQYLATASGPWDLILLDLTDEEGPAEELYRGDFLSTCRDKLAPGGFVVAHVDAPFGRPDLLRKHVNELRSTFRNVRVQLIHVPIYGELAMAVCSNDADVLAVSSDEIERRLDARKVGELRCYDGSTHHARFALPPWVRRLLDDPNIDVRRAAQAAPRSTAS